MTAVYVLAVLCAVAVGLFLWAQAGLRSTKARLAALEKEGNELREAQRALNEKERKQTKLLEERTEELTELKRDFAAQKKKTFSVQEEMKRMRNEMRGQIEDREKLLHERPAFAEPEPAPAPAPRPKEQPQAKPVVVQADPELTERVEKLEADKQRLAAELDEARKALRAQQAETRKLGKRVENFRRVDLVTKSKVQLLGDKLGVLGRRYYDAVSELAALKGEVVPPPSREVLEAREHAAEAAAASAAEPDDEGTSDEATSAAVTS